jgi:hypothetical protein
MKFEKVIALYSLHPGNYINVVLAFLIAGFIGGLGSIIVVGILLTLPYSVIIQANAAADYALCTRR